MTIPVKPGARQAKPKIAKDFQDHLAALEERGLVVRVDRPINKDTELHPLARWQFQGALPEDERRAFLFTNVVGSDGRKYDMPVVAGALAASPEIYALGMGVALDDIGSAWLKAIHNPIPPVTVNHGACQEVVITGDALRAPDGGLKALPVPISTPGFDAAPYLTATICITKDPETGIRNMGTYRGQLKATDRLGVRMASRLGGAGGYLHWQKYQKLKQPMPVAIVIGCAPAIFFTGPQKLAVDFDEMGVAGALIALPDGLMVASRLSSDLNGDTLAAFLPQIFGKVTQCTKELRMGELNNLSFTVGNVPWKIFRVNAIFFAAFGRAGEALPGVQLAALAGELDHRAK